MATNSVDVYVKLPTGRTISFELSPDDRVNCIYSRIANEEGVPAERVKIKYTGKVLKKEHTVGYLGICKETILKAEIIHVKKVQIYVRLPSGRTLQVQLENVSPIYFIKNQVQAEEGVSPRLQILKYGNHVLSNGNESIMDAGIVDEAVMELEIRDVPDSPELKKKDDQCEETSADDMDETDKEAILSSFHCGGKKVEVVFSFDTTGSMYSCLTQVRSRLRDTIGRLLQHIPGIRIGLIAHGDYCDYSNYVIRTVDLTSDVDSLVDFVNNVPSTGGGDAPECYEWVLRVTQQLDWSEESAKALVVIGDSPPHEVSYTDQQVNWHDELGVLAGMDVKVYGVRAQNYDTSTPFYQELASQTGGAYITFNHFSIITDMFMAVCYKEASDEQFDAFCEELQQQNESEDGVYKQSAEATAEMQQVLNQIQQQGEHRPDQPQRYVAVAWWDPSLDHGSPAYHYNRSTDSWQPINSGTCTAPSLSERRLLSCLPEASHAPATSKSSMAHVRRKRHLKRPCVIM